MSDRFGVGLAFVYAQEGGHLGQVTTQASDAGGPTGYHGITQHTWELAIAAGIVDPKPLAKATEADNERVYRRMFWEAARCDSFLAPLDVALFDAFVQHRPKDATRLLQEAASYKGAVGLIHDGLIGGATIAACRFDPVGIAEEYIDRRRNYYRLCPGVEVNFPGWMHRMTALGHLVRGIA
jgi:lysozyme family protein